MTKAKKIMPIDGCIAPQLFTINKDKFIFFEKVNPEEGRFFTLSKNKIDSIYNINEAQGIIEEGDMYTISIGQNTVIKRIENDPLTLNIEGAYFDFKVDGNKNIICLGHNGVKSIIKIFSNTGDEIKNIEINALLFGSSIKVEEEHIWISGFDKENKFKLIKINYIGYVLEEFFIDADADERLISKVKIHKDNIYMLINGKKDSIYVINKKGEKVKEIFPKDIDLKEFIDYEVKEDNIYILNNKKIYVFNISEIVKSRDKYKFDLFVKENIKIPYGYFMIIEILRSYFLGGIISSLFIYTFIYRLGYVNISVIESVCFIWMLSTFLSLGYGLFTLRKKSIRIMYLLNLQKGKVANNITRSLFLYTIFLSIISLLFVYNLRIIGGVVSLVMLIFIFIIDKYFAGYLNDKREDIVVELLSGDKNLNLNLKSLVNKSNKGNKILLNIKVEKDFNKKHLTKWNESRAFILGNNINYVFMNKTFISVVDLSNRDIKYSKSSILADLICYIGEFGNVKEVNAMWVD